MEILDKDFKNGFVSAFQYAVKVVSYYLLISFLETCKNYGLCPTGLSIRKKPFIEFESDELKVFWKETIINTEIFWDELYQLEENNYSVNFKEWLVKKKG